MNKYVNKETLLEEYAGDAEILSEIIQVLLDSYSEKVNKIDEGINNNDIKQVEFFAHNLKGAFLNFHVDAVSSALKEIEFIAKDGSLEGVREKFDFVKEDIIKCIEELKNLYNELQ